jgi:hypothetical protein
LGINGKNNSFLKIIQNKNKLGVYTKMGKQKFDRTKTILGILMLVFAIVPLIAVSASAASGSGDRGYSGHGGGGHGGHGDWGGPGWGGPGFGFYPPAPYGDSGDSEVVCGPYGCYWNEATAYLPKAVIAEQGW